ncbi:GNAT family N-acetyltransferase [Dictyobacter aurantiacus]|uniref:GNAT family N-acetyltransferase n=1 Tax=Dictyobacter aurantiacus TaxID=1936993 RepID=UPI000F830F1E|nr:GNAT family N-acetyltransferase [Dictyobacter aurantiacus]
MHKVPDIVSLRKEDVEVAGEILEQAFAEDPLNVYTAPDPSRRRSLFRWLFTRLVRMADTTYTTAEQIRGVALWVAPQSGEVVEGDVDDLEQMERIFGPEAYQRFSRAFDYFEDRHRQHMQGPHWYLQLLGVAPRWQGQGFGTALMAPALRQADRQGFPCYLETFVAANVPFYQRHGFQVVAAGEEPRSHIPFWSMRREPR